MVEINDWKSNLKIREALLIRLQVIIDTVAKSRLVVGVSYETSAEQPKLIPNIINNLINADPELHFRSCRLMVISEFTYDFTTSHLK